MSDILAQLKAEQEALKESLKTGRIAMPTAPQAGGARGQAKRAEKAKAEAKEKRSLPGAALADQPTTHLRKSEGIQLNETGIGLGMGQIKTLPRPGWALHCIMGGTYHGFDVIPIIQRLAGRRIRSLTIATLGFSKRNTQQLVHMAETGFITGRVDVLCSEFFAKADAPIFAQAKAAIEALPRGGRLEMTRNHAKIILADCGRNHRYVVESSANLRSCVSLEQFQINNDAGLFRFHRRWIKAMIRKPDQ